MLNFIWDAIVAFFGVLWGVAKFLFVAVGFVLSSLVGIVWFVVSGAVWIAYSLVSWSIPATILLVGIIWLAVANRKVIAQSLVSEGIISSTWFSNLGIVIDLPQNNDNQPRITPTSTQQPTQAEPSLFELDKPAHQRRQPMPRNQDRHPGPRPQLLRDFALRLRLQRPTNVHCVTRRAPPTARSANIGAAKVARIDSTTSQWPLR
jgi:hypothetical protein